MRCALIHLTALLALPGLAGATVHAVTAPAQADGAAHTLRQIPEACIRVEGRYTGQVGEPYELTVVPLGGTCQPRARFAGQQSVAELSALPGWQVQQRIVVPSARCPDQRMTFTVWHRDGAGLPAPDGQGQTRVHLRDAGSKQAQHQAARPAYAISQVLEGRCND